MSSEDVGDHSENAEHNDEVVLPDFQTLLRESIGNEVMLVDFGISRLLPKGENYASTILKVDVTIKRTRTSPEEELSLVAKMVPIGKLQKTNFDSIASFTKEIFMFEKLVPTFRQIELETGIRNEDLIDVLPKYYRGKLTKNEKTANLAGNDTILLMENLKARGYYMRNRMEGLDLSHAKLAITELARFHALGMAVKYKRPDFFEAAKSPLSKFPFRMVGNQFNAVTDHTIATIFADPRIAKYEERIKAVLGSEKGWNFLQKVVAIEPWVSVTHGDFWINNIMFHQENDKVDDVKFVDFQMSYIRSPLSDLPFFLCGSVSSDVMNYHLDELLDAYYDRFIEVLNKTGCDSSPFGRDAFEEQLKKDVRSNLMHCLLVMKFFTLEVPKNEEPIDPKFSALMTEGNKLYTERTWKFISKFIEKGWL